MPSLLDALEREPTQDERNVNEALEAIEKNDRGQVTLADGYKQMLGDVDPEWIARIALGAALPYMEGEKADMAMAVFLRGIELGLAVSEVEEANEQEWKDCHDGSNNAD